MNIHKNARLTPHSRGELVRRVLVERQPPMSVATDMGVSIRTVHKWVARYRAEGEAGLPDRLSRPHRLRRPTPPATVERIEALRRQRWTGKRIAMTVGSSAATVSRVLRRLGISKMKALEPAEPVRRYQRDHPGELIHIDIKKLGRFERMGIASPAIAPTAATGTGEAREPAGSSSMSASTMPPVSPSARSCRTRRRRAPSPSSTPPSPIMPASASPSPES